MTSLVLLPSFVQALGLAQVNFASDTVSMGLFTAAVSVETTRAQLPVSVAEAPLATTWRNGILQAPVTTTYKPAANMTITTLVAWMTNSGMLIGQALFPAYITTGGNMTVGMASGALFVLPSAMPGIPPTAVVPPVIPPPAAVTLAALSATPATISASAVEPNVLHPVTASPSSASLSSAGG